MILSSADILKILGGSEIIRLSARISIADSKPVLSGAEGLFIYINRFPTLDEFEATWTLWIESDGSEPDGLVVSEIRRLLPAVTVSHGLLTTLTTTDFRSESTQRAPEAPKAKEVSIDLSSFEDRFQELSEDLQDRMLMVHNGRDGKDGRDGKNGAAGRDGRDLVATDSDLFDLNDVEQGIRMERGQVLTWDGSKWTNLYVRQTTSAAGGGSSDGGGGSGDAVSSTVQWKYDDTELTSTLSDGSFHTDSIDGELVTRIRVSHLTGRNNDISVLIGDLLGQGYDRLYIAQTDDLSQAQLYLITGFASVVDGTELTVVHLVTAGIEPNFLNNKNYEFYISRSASAGGGGVPEAPIDGKQYARENSSWTEVAPTGLQPGDNVSELVNDENYIPEAPQDGNYYVRQNGVWINLSAALSALDDKTIDGGNLTTGSSAGDDETIDGGSFT